MNAKNGSEDGQYIGIDVGGTSIKGGLVTGKGELVLEQSVRTPVDGGGEAIMRDVGMLAGSLIALSEGRAAGIGVGSAGMIDPDTGIVVYATDNLPGWTGRRLAEDLARSTGLPVQADNDVNAAALGESWLGAASGLHTFAFVALGTGVGGAVITRGRILHGFEGRAGEFGHLILKQGGYPCNCGQRGCFEQYTSGTALGRIAKEIDPLWTSYLLLKKFGEGDSRAVEAIERFTEDLAAGLVTIYYMAGPEAILIGGGLGETADLWWHKLEEALRSLTSKNIPVRRAALGSRAGIFGAAYLAVRGSSASNRKEGRP